MLLDLALNITGTGILAFCFTLAIILLTGVYLWRPGTVTSLRKFAPYLVFLTLGLLFVGGKPLIHWLSDMAYGVGDTAPVSDGLGNASDAAVAADQTVGGWVQLGTATSKLIMAAAFYVFFSIITWLMQQITHPAPTEWAKTGYTKDFNELFVHKKFEVYGRIRLNAVLLAAASILGACLIQ